MSGIEYVGEDALPEREDRRAQRTRIEPVVVVEAPPEAAPEIDRAEWKRRFIESREARKRGENPQAVNGKLEELTTLDDTVLVRVSSAEKEEWHSFAAANGTTISALVRDGMNAKIRRARGRPRPAS